MQARFTLSLSVCLIALATTLAGCSDKQVPAPAPSSAQDQKPLAEGQVRVEPGSLKFMTIQEISAEGAAHTVWTPARVAFREENVSDVVSPVAGRVVDMQAQIGDVVKVGSPLASIASPDASRIRADYANAQVELRVAQAEAKRQHLMFDKGVGIEADVVMADAKLQEAEHNVQVASRAAVYLGNGGSDAIVLRSPRAGVVIARTATPGAAVGADSGSLFTIGDPSALWITADVFESDVSMVQQGAKVQIQVPSLDQPLQGKVARVGSSLNPTTRRAPVYITLDQPNAGLRSGMLARAGIETRTPDGLSVPINAVLIKDGQRSIVFVQVDATVFQARAVTLGPPSNGFIPVLSGLSPGDKVVVKGALLLDGSAGQLL